VSADGAAALPATLRPGNPVAAALGQVGLPEPMSALAARDWDAVVVGGGHNGLTAAAYLARAGQSVLVLERRERLGGAATLEQPFADPGYVVSPCAYVLGLLDDGVIDELALRSRGLRFWVADPNLWVPFEDGTSFGQYLDDAKTQANLESLGLSKADIDGYWAYEELFDEVRRKLRKGERDSWQGETPTRAEIEEMLGGDEEMIALVFEDSIAAVLDRYVSDERIKTALYGQGVIGTWGGPFDHGTASVKLMHYQGDLDGAGPVWGYVEGGMGMVSFAIADAAREAGAALACGAEVGAILPGEGVELADGARIRARTVICNADPKVTLRLLGDAPIDGAYRERLEEWKVRSPVVKYNAALAALPDWAAAPGESWPARATIDACGPMQAAQEAFERCAAGEPAVEFGEIYIQTGYDPSPAPEGKHLMSVFGQYAPYDIAGGDWDARRDDVEKQFVDLISRFAPGLGDLIVDSEVLGPPDIESRIGLTGGNIFQGEVTPDQMWENRLSPRTPVPGLYLCGAATHPAGSVIATNGKNAAMAVLADRDRAAAAG
jgi:phytoene dehydrogenase-like protein